MFALLKLLTYIASLRELWLQADSYQVSLSHTPKEQEKELSSATEIQVKHRIFIVLFAVRLCC